MIGLLKILLGASVGGLFALAMDRPISPGMFMLTLAVTAIFILSLIGDKKMGLER